MLAKSAAVTPTGGTTNLDCRASRPSRCRGSSLTTNGPGLTVERYFTRQGVDPFDTVEWERRDAVISGADGKVFFEQRGVEFPQIVVADRDQRRGAEVLPRHARHAAARELGHAR